MKTSIAVAFCLALAAASTSAEPYTGTKGQPDLLNDAPVIEIAGTKSIPLSKRSGLNTLRGVDGGVDWSRAHVCVFSPSPIFIFSFLDPPRLIKSLIPYSRSYSIISLSFMRNTERRRRISRIITSLSRNDQLE